MKDVILPKYFLGNTEDLESESAGPRSFLAADKSKFSLLEWVNDGIEDGRINADISASISDGSKGDIIVFSNGNLWELVDLGVSPGTYISANVTVDSKGRVTAISNGSSSVASGIGVTPTIDLTSTNVQAALEELQSDINTLSATGNAVDISFTPTGNTTSTNVQAAIVEIQTELDSITIPSTYAASDITVTPSGNLTSASVQNALQELQADIDSIIGAASDGNGIYDGNGILPSNVTVDAATHSFVMDDLSQVNFITSGLSSLSWSNPGNLSITINGVAGLSFSDNRGVIYNGDYSANFISRSLVDKAYVDSEISSISVPTTASELPFVATGNTTSTDVQSAIVELQTELDSISISSSADSITFTPTGNTTSTNVQAAIVELQTEIDSITSIPAPAATDISVTPAGTISSNNVQAALQELDTDIQAISIPSTYAATNITVSPSGNLTSTSAQAAFLELQADIDSITIPSTYAASNITVTPSGNLGSTNVQDALVELQTELDNLVIPSTASELPFVPNGSIVATNVQNAINEVQGDINGIVSNPSYTMNLYETNGTLTGNRTITADGNSLTITGLSAAGLSVNSGTKTATFSGVNGWAYLADYSVDFTARSLVDKAYVDNNAYTDSDVETYISANVTYSNIETLTPSGGVVSWTGQESNVYDFTMTANTQIGNPSNPITGAEYTFIARVSSGGPYTISFGTNWKFQGAAPAVALSAGHRAVVKAIYDGTDLLAYRDRLYTT